MKRLTSSSGATISYDVCGSGPSLVLVHGSFSDHHTNWEFVRPMLSRQFTLYAIARRGRGETASTMGHTLADEAGDVAALIEAIDEPVFLLGHSYGAHCALAAALQVPDRVRKLVLYEPPWPAIIGNDGLARLEALGAAQEWDTFAATFFTERLSVPVAEIDALRATPLWPPILADAPASLGDIRALSAYDFDATRARAFRAPVLLQTGSESPPHLYVTAALAEMLPHARVEVLPGQAHEGMTTAPELYAEAVTRFLREA